MCFKWKIAQIRVSDEDFDLKIESQTASNGYTQAGKLKIKQKKTSILRLIGDYPLTMRLRLRIE